MSQLKLNRTEPSQLDRSELNEKMNKKMLPPKIEPWNPPLLKGPLEPLSYSCVSNTIKKTLTATFKNSLGGGHNF